MDTIWRVFRSPPLPAIALAVRHLPARALSASLRLAGGRASQWQAGRLCFRRMPGGLRRGRRGSLRPEPAPDLIRGHVLKGVARELGRSKCFLV
ncbi:MAG: hypothetical protein JRJ38_18840 [Deltaproteobacteria bacterium]|nr:hypothetical protein [Deltaproteobacteria bacterium]